MTSIVLLTAAAFVTMQVVGGRSRAIMTLRSAHSIAASRLFSLENRVFSISKQLELDSDVWEWLQKVSYDRLDMYLLSRVQRQLTNVTSSNRQVVSAYLYSAGSDVVLSTNHMLIEIDNFPDPSLAAEFQRGEQYSWVPNRSERAGISQDRDIVSHLARLNGIGIVSLNISMDVVFPTSVDDGGTLIVLTEAGNPLFSSGDLSEMTDSILGTFPAVATGRISEIITEYAVGFRSSGRDGGLILVSLYPTRLVREMTKSGERVAVLVCGVLVIGLIVGFPVTRRWYLRSTGHDGGVPAEAIDDLQLAFVLDLLSGMAAPSTVDAKGKDLGIHIAGRTMQVYVIQVDDYYGRLLDLDNRRRFEMNRAIGEIAHIPRPAGLEVYFARLEADKIAMLVTNPSGSTWDSVDRAVTTLLTDIRTHVSAHSNITLSVGVGGRCDTAQDVGTSYHDALRALEYKSIYGKASTIVFNEIPTASTRSPSIDPSAIMTLIREQKLGELRSLIDARISEMVSQSDISVDLINAALANAVFAVLKLCLEWRYDVKEVFAEDPLLRLCTLDTVSDKEAYIGRLAETLITVRQSRRSAAQAGVVSQIVQYIRQNYDKDISLTVLADEFRLSPSYISTLIKTELSTGFVEYVNELRIEKAVELLSETNVTIQEIAERCGYYTAHTFIRNFKKAFGVTPGEFRRTPAGVDGGA